MANGIQRTPFDYTDLGGQLLQALVAAEETKGQRERIKLMEKEMGLREKEQKLTASTQLVPGAQADILSQILGQAIAPEQIQVPIAEKQYADLQSYLNANPDIRQMHLNLQATGQPLGAVEGLDAARIAARLKTSPQERIEAGFRLLNEYGGSAGAAFNLLSGRELGIRAPGGKTLAERATVAGEKQANVAGATAEAARVRARQDLIEFLGGGFVKMDPNLPDEEYDAAVGQLVDWATDPSGSRIVDPSVFRKIAPTSKAAAILAAGAKVSPQTEAKIDMVKFLGAQVEKLGDDAPQETVDLLQRYLVEIDQELHPQEQSAPEVAPAPAAAESGVSSAIGTALTGRPFTAAANLLERLMGRPLKPKLRGILEATSILVEPGGEANLMFRALDGAVKEIGNVLGGPIPPPAKTVGPLSDPALAIPDDARSKMLQLVSAYRAAGGTPEEARELELDLRTVVEQGDPEAMKEMFDAVVAEIEDRKKASR